MTDVPRVHFGGGLRLLALLSMAALAACATTVPGEAPVATPAPPPEPQVSPELMRMYGPVQDGETMVPAIPAEFLSEENARQIVDYWTDEPPGTIVVDPYERYLYLVREDDKAMRYRVGVGEAGRGLSGEGNIPYTREWPRWTPTQNMLREKPDLYEPVRNGVEGGLDNPLGARALYLFQNGQDTLYRIHGTPQPWTIGKATSAGCIRLYNQDIIDLHERVDGGTKVVVLSESESGKGTVPPAWRAATVGESSEGDTL